MIIGGDDMKAVGIVVEYNPLHYGHIHHIKEAKALTGADVMIAVMSGHVVQRGNFSIADKFQKTKWAMQSGVDLVIELPSVFVLQSADLFARTSVQLLDYLNVEFLVFGSETGNIEQLKKIAKIMRDPEYQTLVKAYMSQGYSYPNSCGHALKNYNQSNIHEHPNNILGLQYIQAIHHLKSPIEALTIQRIESDYHDALKPNQIIQSASAIRQCIKNNTSITQYVPKYVNDSLNQTPYIDIESYIEIFQALLATHNAETLNAIFSFEEGFENRLLKVENFSSVATLVEQVKTPRYTHAKIHRSLMHMLLNIQKETLSTFDVPYIRVLGMNKKGQAYLNQVKKTLEVPLITKIKQDRHPYLEIELNITKLYDLKVNKALFKKEFNPLIIF